MASPFRLAGDLLAASTRDGRVPAAALEVGSSREPVWQMAWTAGRPDGDLTHAIWDLASLTKVIATTSLTAAAVAARRLCLDQAVADHLPEWTAARDARLRVRDLLAHCTGLPAYRPLYETCAGRDGYVRAISDTPLAYPPRTRAVYSDLGFILLGLLLERAMGATLAAQMQELGLASRDPWLGFGVPSREQPPHRVQTTGIDPWRGHLPLCGEVHDRNAAAIGGVAGHAGLFGTASAVGAFARRLLRARRQGDEALGPAGLVRSFLRRTPIPGSSRALGWDTMLPTSSCGGRLSAAAIGHTGFTGTSLWVDPSLDLYVVLLTNRVAGTATERDITTLRRAVHEAVATAWPRDIHT
jgi:serine-type D-Ala-D-Ala carboxypeptidase